MVLKVTFMVVSLVLAAYSSIRRASNVQRSISARPCADVQTDSRRHGELGLNLLEAARSRQSSCCKPLGRTEVAHMHVANKEKHATTWLACFMTEITTGRWAVLQLTPKESSYVNAIQPRHFTSHFQADQGTRKCLQCRIQLPHSCRQAACFCAHQTSRTMSSWCSSVAHGCKLDTQSPRSHDASDDQQQVVR